MVRLVLDRFCCYVDYKQSHFFFKKVCCESEKKSVKNKTDVSRLCRTVVVRCSANIFFFFLLIVFLIGAKILTKGRGNGNGSSCCDKNLYTFSSPLEKCILISFSFQVEDVRFVDQWNIFEGTALNQLETNQTQVTNYCYYLNEFFSIIMNKSPVFFSRLSFYIIYSLFQAVLLFKKYKLWS